MSFTKGQIIKVLTGKYKDQTAEVVTEKSDPSGLTRIQVKLAGQIFSYLPKSVEALEEPTSEAKILESAIEKERTFKPITDAREVEALAKHRKATKA